MRKILIFTIVISMFNTSASCGSAMKSFLGLKNSSFYDSPEHLLKEQVNKLEVLNSRLRNSSDNKDPAFTNAIWKKIEKLDNNIFTKHYSVNVRDWRVFFREFETNFISFKRLSHILENLGDNPTQASLKSLCVDNKYSQEFTEFIVSKFKNSANIELFRVSLEKEVNSNLIHIGNHYFEYRLVMEHLRDLKGSDLCNSDCEVELKKLLSNLGVKSKNEQTTFPVIFKGEKRPDLNDLTNIVHANPIALITKLKRERNVELRTWLVSLLLQPEIIDSIMGLIYKSKRLGKYRAVKLFQLFYNAQARNLHFPKINTVVKNFQNDIDKSYSNLKAVNTSVPKDELLVTFARMVDVLAVKKWKQLLANAKATDAKFYERMIEAQKKAQARGDISITHRRSLVGQIVQFIPASTPIYFYQRAKLEERATVMEVDENGNEIVSTNEESIVIPIEHESEADLAIEEAVEVITQKDDIERDPSSVKKSWIEVLLEKLKGLIFEN